MPSWRLPGIESVEMSQPTKKQLYVVLGMHRSGTSAITRSLAVLGIQLGERLLPPVEGDNDKGFWEDIDLHSLDIEMMKFLGTEWSHVAMITPADVIRLQEQGFFLRAVELIRRKISDSNRFGFKDPRVAKLMPFWREVFAHCDFEVTYVFAMRNPLSVARSLGKRDGMASEQSYWAWFGHVITGLVHSAGSACVMVDYDRLMQAPESELERLSKALNLGIDVGALQAYKEDFLDENLRHTVYAADDLQVDQTCPPLVHEVYSNLLEVACDRLDLQDPELQARIEKWFKQYEQLQYPLRLADKLLTQKADARAHIAEQVAQLRELQQKNEEALATHGLAISERDARLGTLEEHLKSREQQTSALEQVIVERGEQLNAANAALAERAAQLNGVNTALAERDAHLNALRAEMAESNGQLNGLVTALGARDAQLNELISLLAEAQARHANETTRLQHAVLESEMQIASLRKTVQELHSSTSWRVSAPIRWLGSAARALTGGTTLGR